MQTIGNYVQRHPSLRRHGRLLRLKVRYSGEGASGSKEDARPGPEDERLLQALERRGMVLGQRLYRLLGLRPGDKRNGGQDTLWLYAADSTAGEPRPCASSFPPSLPAWSFGDLERRSR